MEHARLVATFRASSGTLARLAATLTHHHVLSVVYTRTSPELGTAIVRLPRSEATRALQKLRRLVETIEVTLAPLVHDTTTADSRARDTPEARTLDS